MTSGMVTLVTLPWIWDATRLGAGERHEDPPRLLGREVLGDPAFAAAQNMSFPADLAPQHPELAGWHQICAQSGSPQESQTGAGPPAKRKLIR